MSQANNNGPNYAFILIYLFVVCFGLAALVVLLRGNSHEQEPKAQSITATINDTPAIVDAEVKKPETAWQYSKSIDELSGKSAYSADVKSSNFQSFDFPYGGDTYGTLTLRKHPRYGKDLIFQIDRGQILCHSYSGCPISIRFDEGTVIKVEGNPPSDNSSEVVFLPYSRFIKKIKKSKKIVIGAPVYQEGEPAFIFDTKNLNWKE